MNWSKWKPTRQTNSSSDHADDQFVYDEYTIGAVGIKHSNVYFGHLCLWYSWFDSLCPMLTLRSNEFFGMSSIFHKFYDLLLAYCSNSIPSPLLHVPETKEFCVAFGMRNKNIVRFLTNSSISLSLKFILWFFFLSILFSLSTKRARLWTHG